MHAKMANAGQGTDPGSDPGLGALWNEVLMGASAAGRGKMEHEVGNLLTDP